MREDHFDDVASNMDEMQPSEGESVDWNKSIESKNSTPQAVYQFSLIDLLQVNANSAGDAVQLLVSMKPQIELPLLKKPSIRSVLEGPFFPRVDWLISWLGQFPIQQLQQLQSHELAQVSVLMMNFAAELSVVNK
jgi:hypothetical protein